MSGGMLCRTRVALGDELLQKIAGTNFCIVGCGATGTAFAEMLVRTGAKSFSLIDADKVEDSNLNRCIGFTQENISQRKTEALARRIKAINPAAEVFGASTPFVKENPADADAERVRQIFICSDFVFIGTDTNRSRIWCEELLVQHPDIDYLSTGIFVDAETGRAGYECTWLPTTPPERADDEGYGKNNGSYAAVVLEAAAVAFHMLLHHFQNPESKEFRSVYKEYKNFAPVPEQGGATK